MDTSLRGATATRQSRATSETLDCFVAEPVIGPAQESRTRWLLAMTAKYLPRSCLLRHRSRPRLRDQTLQLGDAGAAIGAGFQLGADLGGGLRARGDGVADRAAADTEA